MKLITGIRLSYHSNKTLDGKDFSGKNYLCHGIFNDDNLHYILSYQISKSILKASNEPTFGFYWLRAGSVIAIKPRLLIAPKIIFNLVFSTEVRAIIKTSFYTEQRVPFGKHIPTYQKMTFSQGIWTSCP